MIAFPNCKINLGLNIVSRREDGYHDIETVFYPLPLQDVLEIISSDKLEFSSSGRSIPGDPEENLCIKAWHSLKQDFPRLPPVKIHLHKNIPIGAGLGGGSADAAQTLVLLNEKFGLGILAEQLALYALQLGSDCAFFIYNRPCIATGRGERLEPLPLDLGAYSFLLVAPPVHIDTRWAYSLIEPGLPALPLKDILRLPMEQWKGRMKNDFEEGVLESYPLIKTVKEQLYAKGALYAAMSGSGSAVFGIFPKNKIAGIAFETGYQVSIIN